MKTTQASFESMRAAILNKRYLWKNKHWEVVETEDQMYNRIATTIAKIEGIHGATKTHTKALANKFYRMMKDGKFPKQYRLSERTVGWKESEVSAWAENRELAA